MPNLTNSELQMLELIKEGYSNKQVALKLGISYQTVKNTLYNLFYKLDVPNRTVAVIKGLGLVSAK